MKAFKGYEETKVDFAERIKLGGHICKILEVKIEEYTTKEGKKFEQMIMKIDTTENDIQPGYYQKKFAEDAKTDAMKAKWKGYYRLPVPSDDSDEQTKTTFKRFITCVEKSNPGFTWNWEENLLIGKLFGGVFGLEEFQGTDGNTISFTKCRYARSIEKIEEAEIPKVRLLDKSLMDYEEYIEKRKAEREAKSNNTTQENTTFEGSSDDLPF